MRLQMIPPTNICVAIFTFNNRLIEKMVRDTNCINVGLILICGVDGGVTLSDDTHLVCLFCL